MTSDAPGRADVAGIEGLLASDGVVAPYNVWPETPLSDEEWELIGHVTARNFHACVAVRGTSAHRLEANRHDATCHAFNRLRALEARIATQDDEIVRLHARIADLEAQLDARPAVWRGMPVATDDPAYHCPRCGLDDAGIRVVGEMLDAAPQPELGNGATPTRPEPVDAVDTPTRPVDETPEYRHVGRDNGSAELGTLRMMADALRKMRQSQKAAGIRGRRIVCDAQEFDALLKEVDAASPPRAAQAGEERA